MEQLTEKQCTACQGNEAPLKGPGLQKLAGKLEKGWNVVEEHHLEKEYLFKNFREALTFTNKVGELAEKEGHHPNIHLEYGRVVVTMWTHKIDGLTESDFVFAAKTDALT